MDRTGWRPPRPARGRCSPCSEQHPARRRHETGHQRERTATSRRDGQLAATPIGRRLDRKAPADTGNNLRAEQAAGQNDQGRASGRRPATQQAPRQQPGGGGQNRNRQSTPWPRARRRPQPQAGKTHRHRNDGGDARTAAEWSGQQGQQSSGQGPARQVSNAATGRIGRRKPQRRRQPTPTMRSRRSVPAARQPLVVKQRRQPGEGWQSARRRQQAGRRLGGRRRRRRPQRGTSASVDDDTRQGGGSSRWRWRPVRSEEARRGGRGKRTQLELETTSLAKRKGA